MCMIFKNRKLRKFNKSKVTSRGPQKAPSFIKIHGAHTQTSFLVWKHNSSQNSKEFFSAFGFSTSQNFTHALKFVTLMRSLHRRNLRTLSFSHCHLPPLTTNFSHLSPTFKILKMLPQLFNVSKFHSDSKKVGRGSQLAHLILENNVENPVVFATRWLVEQIG